MRLALTVLLAIALAVVFVKMIVPDKEDRSVPPDTAGNITPGVTPRAEFESPDTDEMSAPGDSAEVVRVYHGQAEEPIDDPKLTWEITLEMSDRSLFLLEGTVTARDFVGEPPKSDLSFSIAPNHYTITLTESETVTVQLDGAYDPLTAAPFSINDKGQFFIYLTPKKLSMSTDVIPPRFLTDRENSPLISMQGFIRSDHRIVGTLRSVFGPNIEYLLEPVATE